MRWLLNPLAWLAAAFALALPLAFPCRALAYPYATWERVDDKPLLETVEQVRDARLHGACSFRIGSEHFVVENLPRGYVDYSAVCARMP